MPRDALDRRLKQRGRRSGVMIGVSMMAALALIIVGFTVVYTALDPFFADFVSDVDDDAITTSGETSVRSSAPEPTDEPAATDEPEANESDEGNTTILGGEAPTAPASEPTASPDEDSGDFQPDYVVNQRINLRSGPGTNNAVVQVLESGTELQQIGDDGSPANTAPDQRWLEFRTEDGDEGWIREIDVDET